MPSMLIALTHADPTPVFFSHVNTQGLTQMEAFKQFSRFKWNSGLLQCTKENRAPSQSHSPGNVFPTNKIHRRVNNSVGCAKTRPHSLEWQPLGFGLTCLSPIPCPFLFFFASSPHSSLLSHNFCPFANHRIEKNLQILHLMKFQSFDIIFHSKTKERPLYFIQPLWLCPLWLLAAQLLQGICATHHHFWPPSTANQQWWGGPSDSEHCAALLPTHQLIGVAQSGGREGQVLWSIWATLLSLLATHWLMSGNRAGTAIWAVYECCWPDLSIFMTSLQARTWPELAPPFYWWHSDFCRHYSAMGALSSCLSCQRWCGGGISNRQKASAVITYKI